ncbi:DNA-binding protein [Paenibacillus psychroresistens]|uniref:DNA-binding protein n=1 Tax=Paenibacillus psychroresistens TaxID=1778678 RepID=A0A6B8RKE7_9BACL|nr:helix-turn-helix domain-containing protein [Paenibacillus psychroresistens]QGQ95828.1 DNA-binding protein [Paenibacillus psychroresistens]
MKTPTTLPDALRLAADLAEHNAQLEQALTELRMNNEYPEILRPVHMEKLFNIGKSTISEWTRDPDFPVMNKNRRKGEAIYVLKSDLYQWLRTRKVAN